MLVAGFLRAYWLVSQDAVIESEGAEYARIAQNLLAGNGYVGLLRGTELMFPPLYPILIALFSLFTRDFDVAGRLVSLTIGTCLLLPVFFIARRMYDHRVAFISASLIGLHPLLVALSASVYAESLFLTLIMGGMYWGLQSLRLKNARDNVLSGVCLGLAYLTRPEAIAFPFLIGLAIVVVALTEGRKLRRAFVASALILASFTVLAAPYIFFLSLHSGRFRVEGKSDMIFEVARRMNAGMSYQEATVGISRDLKEEGPYLKEDVFVTRASYPPSFGDRVHYALEAAKRNKAGLREILTSRAFGSPVLVGLLIVGLFRKAWSRKRLIHEGFLLVMVGFMFGLLLQIHGLQFRYGFPVLPFLLLWASKGIDEVSRWAKMTGILMRIRLSGKPNEIGIAARWGLSIALLVVASVGMPGVGEFEQAKPRNLAVKNAGLWLAGHAPGPKTIMDVSGVIPYYAGGFLLPLPYAEPSVALRYIGYKNPDFIILNGRLDRHVRPYLEDWIKNGIPDERAKLIWQTGKTLEERIEIYGWEAGKLPAKVGLAGRDRDLASDLPAPRPALRAAPP